MRIELDQIHKRYDTVHANRGVDLTVEAGTVHGVLGENGAGKSTLMKILAGFARKSSGRIRLDGEEVEFDCPADALRRGVGMLYQDPLDFPPLTSLENFTVGAGYRSRTRRQELLQRARALGFSLHPGNHVDRLTVGERQQLELVRLLDQGARVLILDEPTTGISDTQKRLLFSALRTLAARGSSVLLVSHKLEDVMAVCDRVTVLRHGRAVGTVEVPFAPAQVLELMFDQTPAAPSARGGAPGEVVLQTQGLSADGGRAGLRDCSLAVRRGEVVALAGVEGSGQGLLLRVAAGLVRPRRGSLKVNGTERRANRWSGVTFLPTARLEEGLVAGLTVAEHFALNQRRIPFWAPWRRVGQAVRGGIQRYRVRGEPETPVEELSGGNQQRLLLSLIPSETDLLLLENPTRGLDLESAHWVWSQLQQLGAGGTGILFSSAELDEILAVSDRVLVFFEGRVVLDLPTAETDAAQLGHAIAGGTGPVAAAG